MTQKNLLGQTHRNLLIVSDNFPPPIKGGSSTVALNHFSLLKEYFNVHILTTWEELKTPCVQNENIHRLLMPKEIWRNNSDIKELFEKEKNLINLFFRENSFDIILNLHMWNICAETVCYLSQIDIPQIHRFGDEWMKFHILNSKDKTSNGWVEYNPNKFKLTNCIVNSNELFRRIKVMYPSAEIHLLRNFVDLDVFKFNEREISFPLKLIYVGRLVTHKGVHICIETLSEIKKKFPDKEITLSIYGSIHKNEYYKSLIELCEELKLEDSITWGGNINHNEVSSVLNEASILLFPSLPRKGNHTIEGCPNILLEAMAVGVPIISTSQEGHEEILVDAKNCLVSNANSRSISDKVSILIEDLNLASSIINQAYIAVIKNHSRSMYREYLLNLFWRCEKNKK